MSSLVAVADTDSFEFVANLVPFDTWKSTHWEKKAGKPFEATIGNTPSFFFLRRTDFTKEEIRTAGEPFYNADHCIECKSRISRLIRLIDSNGDPVLFSNPKDSYPKELHALWELSHRKILSTHGFELELVQKDSMFALTCGKDASTGEAFPHLNIWPTSHTKVPYDVEICAQAGYHKYFPLIMSMFTANGVNGITDSLSASIALFNAKDASDQYKIPYGDKIKWAFEWMKTNITDTFSHQSPLDQVVQVTHALFSGNLSPNSVKGSDPIMTVFHQMNLNGLDVMKCANDEKAFITIMKDRFSPENHCRPTAAPSTGQVNNAINMLGDFKNTIMTRSQAIDEFGAIPYALATDPVQTAVAVADIHSSMNAFDKMKVSANPNESSGAAGFASRVKKTSSEILTPKTLQDLLNIPGVYLEVNVSSMTPGTACTTTLGHKVKYPHLWMFHQYQSPSKYGMKDNWARVTAILPVNKEGGRHRSYIFICSTATPHSSMPNCCFPDFLSTEYARTCRNAFEQLNGMTHPVIPSEGPYAMGVGTSITGTDGSFVRAFKVRVNGKEATISKFA